MNFKYAEKKRDFSVFVSMCVHRHIDPGAYSSLLKLLLCPNPKMVFSRHMGDALIDRARSIQASNFLMRSSEDVLLFLDDDIVYDELDIVKLCRFVYEGHADIAGATYIVKRDRGSHITAKPFPNQTITFGPDSPPVEVRSVATGCMAINRRVLTELSNTMALCHPKSLCFYPFFQPFPKQFDDMGWIYLSEDWAFCERARDAGFKVFLDPSIRLKHIGPYAYELEDLTRTPKEPIETITYTDPS